MLGGATAFAAVASASAADLALPSERAAVVRTAAASQRPAVVRQEMVRGIAAAGIAVCLEPPAMADGAEGPEKISQTQFVIMAVATSWRYST